MAQSWFGINLPLSDAKAVRRSAGLDISDSVRMETAREANALTLIGMSIRKRAGINGDIDSPPSVNKHYKHVSRIYFEFHS